MTIGPNSNSQTSAEINRLLVGSDHDAQTLDIRTLQNAIGNASVNVVRRAVFLNSLVSMVANGNTILKASIPANDDDPVNIAYFHDPFVTPGGVLANYVQSIFNFSNTQMSALFTNAATASNISNYNYTNLSAAYPIAQTSDAQTGTSNSLLMTPAATVAAIKYLLLNLPKTLPATAGVLWNDGGVIAIS